MLNVALLALSSLVDPIVGGTPAEPGAWPDVVAVIAPAATCSGTLIAPDVVLTAAHCIGTHPALVVADSVDYSKPGGEAIAVAAAYAYPSWQTTYDVGVLVLAHPAHVAPRAIVDGCVLRTGLELEVVGYGLTAPLGENTALHQAYLSIDDPTCTLRDCHPAIAPGGELVAGGSGHDACFGDSGGPALIESTDGPAIVGVVSRAVGRTCRDGEVFVRADAVVAWIERVTGRAIARAACAEPADDRDGGCCASGDLGSLGAFAIVLAMWLGRLRRP